MMLGNLDCSVNLSFVSTLGLNLNKCLHFSVTSHCLSHFVIHDSRAPFRISIIDDISSDQRGICCSVRRLRRD